VRELFDRVQVRFGGQRDGVEGARAAADDAVRFDARLQQRLQHADTAGASAAAAAQDKHQPALLLASAQGRGPAPTPP